MDLHYIIIMAWSTASDSDGDEREKKLQKKRAVVLELITLEESKSIIRMY